MRHFIIDTDTASDDAVGLIMAMRYPGVQIEAITVVAGNVPVDQAVQNALYTVELCQQSIPVYRGMSAPLVRPLFTAHFVHGQDGMGDIGLPLAGRRPAAGHAVDILVDNIHRFAGDIILLTLGPLTNVASALQKDPRIAGEVRECVVMGGTGRGHGNITPVGEYNFWADPDAAKIVFESGMRLKMVGWDISRTYAVLNPQDTADLRGFGTPLAAFCVDIQATLTQFAMNQSKLQGFDLPDAIATAIALEPEVATETRSLFVAIENESDLCRGQSVVDHYGVLGEEPNTEVVLNASRKRFWDMLCDAVRPL
ncbi:MAG: nucleoside hydrolase [Chloroflexota bacterium]|nr:MAG: nucleoside hydrolase [Chloroflexota bacterium]